MGTVRGNPDRLDAYTAETLPEVGLALDSLQDYTDAVLAFNGAAPNDLGNTVADHSGTVGEALDGLALLDAMPAAFAAALRAVDTTSGLGADGGTWLQSDDSELVNAFVMARLTDPTATDEQVLEQAQALKEAVEEQRDDDGGGFWGGVGDFFQGAWDSVAEPVKMVWELRPFHDGTGQAWSDLGSGLWYGVTHPLDFGKALIGWEHLADGEYAYWAGNVVPGAVAAFFTGGGSAALRGGSATARVARGAENAEDLVDAAGDVRRLDDLADVGGTASRMPDWLRERMEAGNEFNRTRYAAYDHSEVHVDSGSGTYNRLDSYTPNREIVSRKYTQLGDVQPATAIRYLNEIPQKYGPSQVLPDTPRNRELGLAGERLQGEMILEIPPQTTVIPEEVLRHADEIGVTIRDSEGRIYELVE